jgi:hypothetical protein
VLTGSRPAAHCSRLRSGDPPIFIAWPGVHQAPDIGREFCIFSAGLGTCSLNQIGSGYPEGLCDPLHGVSSGGCDRDSKVGFLPVQGLRTSATTSSSARTASLPPSLISRIHGRPGSGRAHSDGQITDRHARLPALVDDQKLLLRRKPPPTSNAGDDFHVRKRLGHRHMPRTMLSSSG